MMKEIKPTRKQFVAYTTIQESGVTNMLDVKTVIEVALIGLGVELSKENCIYIYNHYSELIKEYFDHLFKYH